MFTVVLGSFHAFLLPLLEIPITHKAVEDYIMNYTGILYWSDKGFHHTRLHICPSVTGAEAILQTLDLIAFDSTEGRLCVAVITLLNSVVPQSLTYWFLFTRPHVTSNVTVCLNRLHSLSGMTKA